MQLSGLYIYPVKSLGGLSVSESRVELRGLQYDRRWMLTDAEGIFLSQREIPRMALLRTSIEPPFLYVFHCETPHDRVAIPLEPDPLSLRNASLGVWSDRFRGFFAEGLASEWLSDQLGHAVRLAFMPETSKRHADTRYAPKGQYVSFADGFPFLMIGQASLDELNGRLKVPLGMERFRPNFVFTGSPPYHEDTWSDFMIGSIPFQCVKPCARCSITTTDQTTGERGKEPLQTLSTYRMQAKRILFGQNVIWTGTKPGDTIRTGMEIKVLNQRKESNKD